MKTTLIGIPRGWHLLPVFDSINSTNTWLKQNAASLNDRTILIAREQSEGRGRNERRFHSAKGKGLYLSLLLKPDAGTLSFSKMTALSALALQRAIRESCQLECQIKWVNDLLYQDHKIAGILCESLYQGNAPAAFIIGFGVNVFSQTFPAMEQNRPGSIADFSIIPPSMDSLTVTLLHQMDDCLRRIDDPALMQEYKKNCCSLKRTILVKEAKQTYEAYAEDIDDDGRLIIVHDNERKRLYSGEISIRMI